MGQEYNEKSVFLFTYHAAWSGVLLAAAASSLWP
jgi:hypothetical protein